LNGACPARGDRTGFSLLQGEKLRLGLCCLFCEQPITFRDRQATHLGTRSRDVQLELLSATILHNALALEQALVYCRDHHIGSFRISSRFLPLKTHPQLAYSLEELPGAAEISDQLRLCRVFAGKNDLRLTFHPDQFTLLSSPRPEVTENSLRELVYHAEIAELVGADVIMIHGGGAYGDKKAALDRLENVLDRLPEAVRRRLALENDDRIYSPGDLLPLCRRTGIPLVYDVHHHRCLSDRLTVEEASAAALASWDREPLFHLSSPRDGWQATDNRPHHDYIDIADFPGCWSGMSLTMEIEAKAKELAVMRFQREWAERGGGSAAGCAEQRRGGI
jgi:UV DNA damage endonuclease